MKPAINKHLSIPKIMLATLNFSAFWLANNVLSCSKLFLFQHSFFKFSTRKIDFLRILSSFIWFYIMIKSETSLFYPWIRRRKPNCLIENSKLYNVSKNQLRRSIWREYKYKDLTLNKVCFCPYLPTKLKFKLKFGM